MSIKSQLVQELDNLSEEELGQLAEYMIFLKFRSKIKPVEKIEDSVLAEMYAEFAEEDKELAELGMPDYARGLEKEDSL
jgi:hypothetical protein